MPLLWRNVVPLMFTCGQLTHLHVSSSATRQVCLVNGQVSTFNHGFMQVYARTNMMGGAAPLHSYDQRA